MSQAQDPPGFAGALWALGGPWAPASPTWLRESAEIQTLHLVPPFAPLPFEIREGPSAARAESSSSLLSPAGLLPPA